MKAVLSDMLRLAILIATALAPAGFAESNGSSLLPLFPLSPAAPAPMKVETDTVLHPPLGQPAPLQPPVTSTPLTPAAPAAPTAAPPTTTPPSAATPSSPAPPIAAATTTPPTPPIATAMPAPAVPTPAKAQASATPTPAPPPAASPAPTPTPAATPAAALLPSIPPTPGTDKRAPAEEPKKESLAESVLPLPEFPKAAPTPNPKSMLAPPAPAAPKPAPILKAAQLLPTPGLTHDLKPTSGLPPVAEGPEVSIILAENRFYPSKLRLKEGQPVHLVFTTVNPHPAALIFEGLGLQRWLRSDSPPSTSEEARARWEVTREIASDRLTEIPLEPRSGTYSFHDAFSGATGEINVE